MSHLGRKYQDLDTSQDRIMHSTPKYGRDSYDSRVTSYVPGELRRSSENDLSNITEQVSRNESVTLRSGVSRNVSQHVTSSNASSSRDFGFTSDEGRKGLHTEQSIKATGDARSSALNSRRASGDALLEGDNLSGDSILKSSLMETSRSRYTSGASRDDKFGGGINSRNEHSMASRPTEMGFQYEDIQSFRERQKIEGDRLQVHRGSLSGDIVGMVKKEDILSPDSGYSSGVATDLEKSRDGNIHSYSSSVREYKSSYGDYEGSRPSSDKILVDAKSSVGASGVSHLHSSITTQDYKSSRDDRSGRFSKDRMLENEKGKTSDDVLLSSSRGGTDYKLSSDRGVSDTDRSKLLRDLKSDSKDVTAQLHTRHSDYKSTSANDSVIPRDERFSKTDALVAKYLDSSRYKSKRGSDLDFEHKHLSSLTEIKEEEKGDSERKKHKEDDIGEKHHSVSGKPTSYLPKESSYKELLKKKKEDSSPKSSEASSVLDKREISSQSKFTYGDISNKSDLKSDYKDSRSGYLPGSSGKIGERPELPRRSSYDWQDDRKARQQAIDRLLDSTRRYSVDSILDRTSHDKKLDDVIDAMTTKDLDSSTSHVERHVRETKIGGKPDITGKSRVDDMLGTTGVYHRRLSNKTSSEMDTDRKFTGGGDYEQIGMKEKEKARDDVTPVERLPKNEDRSRAPYETPYTSLDHSHYKPSAFGVNVDHDDRIYAVPLKTSKYPEKNKPESSHPDFSDKQIGGISGKSGLDYPPAYEPSSTSNKPEDDRKEVIYDKLRRGSGPLEKPLSTNLNTSKKDNRRGSIEGLDEPIYERLYLSSDPELRSPKRRDSPVPMSDHFGLPLDKYNKPVALHGKTGEPANPDDAAKVRDIVSRHPERQLIDRPRGDFSDFMRDEVCNVTETTRTSYMQRSFVSRNGEVIKDEVKRHDEIRHGGQNAIEGIEEKRIDAEIPTRIQRYPAAKREEIGRHDLKTELRDTKETTEDKRAMSVTPDDHKLDEIMKLTGLENKGDVTKYHKHSRRDDVTHIHDDSNIRTKVHRSDVDTKVNIVKEISAPKKDKPANRRSGIADLRSKIEALTKSVDELMDYKKRTLLRSYVKEHAERRGSKDIEEQLPKIERYKVKSKRYEPKDIGHEQVDCVYKKLDLEEMSRKPEHTNVELNIKSLWLSEEEQTGKDIGLHIPKQINLAPENRTVEWWNADTAEAADRFLCIGDWRWWNANTTEGVDHILGIQAINKETGATGAIIAKYQGEEKPIEWAWLEASNQPSAAQKRRTLTRVLMIDRENEGSDWSNSAISHDTNQHLSIGNLNWWDASTTEGVDQILGVRGSNKETGTILATYDESTKPNAWTWVQTSQNVPEVKVEKKHTITRSSRDIYVDETDNGKVELLIRIKDEETTDPRYIAIRSGPIEKAIIVHQALESEMPYTKNLRVEGKQGEGLQVRDGVVQMKIKDMTPEARQAWMQIMGIEKRQMKLHENETVEIPVKVMDKPHNTKSIEDLYAVPIKKKKKKQPVSTTSVKVEEKKKLEQKKSTEVEKKKKEKKESETEKKKREMKLKKIEAEKKKKEEVEKKKKEELERKKKEELERKKKEEKIKLDKKRNKDIEIQKKKRESEKLKEKEMERIRKEQLKSKEALSVKKEKVAKEDMPPPVDRSTKPKPKMMRDTYTQEIRRHSDVVDAGMGQRSEQFQRGSSKRMSHVDVSTRHYGSVPSSYGNKIKSSKTVTQVQGGSFSPKKSGPFVTAGGRVVTPKVQSARARITSSTQSQSVKTEFEERGNLTRKQSPSVKVVKRVSVTQSGKTHPYSTDQTTSIQHKSGSIQRRSGGSIAVPLRGGSSKQTNSSVKIIGSQSVKGQLSPNQHMRQTTVEESHHYRTETHITSDDGRAVSPGIHAVAPQLAKVGQVGPGHSGIQHDGLGHVGGSGHVGGAPVMRGHLGGQVGGGQAGAGSAVLPNMPTETSTDYSYNESDHHQLPDGTYVQRDVSHIRRTDWSVQEMSTKGQSKC